MEITLSFIAGLIVGLLSICIIILTMAGSLEDERREKEQGED